MRKEDFNDLIERNAILPGISTKEDLIRALKNLEAYFQGDDIQLMHFKYQAKIIENSYDYLMERLRHSEVERFKNA